MSQQELRPLTPNGDFFKTAQHAYTVHNASTPGELSKDDLTNPRLWALCSNKIRPGDEIRCLADDNTYLARLLVMFVNGSDVRVAMESFTSLKSEVEKFDADGEEYVVKNGGNAGWYIQKVSTKERVVTRIATEQEAYDALVEYKAKMAA